MREQDTCLLVEIYEMLNAQEVFELLGLRKRYHFCLNILTKPDVDKT